MTDVATFVAESRASQGLPPHIVDRAAIKRIVRILVKAKADPKPSPKIERLAS